MWASIIVILNLLLIEVLLSVDNASALAVMVSHLPEKQRAKALRYGLLGAYIFRGVSLFLVSWLMKILWLKIAGGVYLLYLTYNYFKSKAGDDDTKTCNKSFWMTVLSVEILDLSLSIDNVFAAVALSSNIYIILAGVFIGILAMRFIAGWFVKLIAKYPLLESSAFIVIGMLGVKLVLSGACEYLPTMSRLKDIMNSHLFDFGFSICMMLIFFVPIVFRKK